MRKLKRIMAIGVTVMGLSLGVAYLALGKVPSPVIGCGGHLPPVQLQPTAPVR
jgi:hypothetical protein